MGGPRVDYELLESLATKLDFGSFSDVSDLEIDLLAEPELFSSSDEGFALFWLKYAVSSRDGDQKEFLCDIPGEDLYEPGTTGEVHPQYNLRALSSRELGFDLPVSKQLYVCNLALEKIARFDPCIKSGQKAPGMQIVSVGGKRYDPEFMREFYLFVQEELKNFDKPIPGNVLDINIR